MDIEKLIEQLKYYGTTYAIGDNLGKEVDGSDELMLNAATALSTLQAENAQLRESRDHWKRLAHELSEGVNGKDAEHERLQAENEKLRNEVERQRRSADDRKHLYENAERAYMKVVAELEQVKRERDALIDDFVDYVTGGVPNPAIFCKNRCDKCTDMRGWCTGKDCKGFYPSGANGQKED